MNRKRSEQLLDAWQGGLSLNAALDLFNPKFDRSELALSRRSHLQTIQIAERNFAAAGMSYSSGDTQKLRRQLLRFAAAGIAHKSKQSQLIEALEAGRFVALGYPTDQPKAQAPEPVPQFLLQPRYAKFRKSEFTDGQHRYSNVRIVASDVLPTTKIGRPSLQNLVADLASALSDRGEISADTKPKVQVTKIRKLGNLGEGTLSDQTIIRHLKTFWAA